MAMENVFPVIGSAIMIKTVVIIAMKMNTCAVSRQVSIIAEEI